MARIPDAELERLKRETDLVALVQAAGVALRRHGADLVGRCPFHEDRGPSLVVTPAKGLWHCLGACQAGGSAIDWVMRTEKVSFRHAVERLLKREGTAPSAPPRLAPLVRVGFREVPTVDDQALLKQVVDYYHETLKGSPEAIAYLESRGLNDVALIDRFRLGFANRTLGYRLPKPALKAGAEIRGQLQRLGVLRESGHEHLRGSLVVPVLGERGHVAQCYGRKITPNLRAGTPDHLYLPGPHTAVWNVEALAVSKEIILCEALLDAMTFWVAGFHNVITSYGVSGFTDAHRAALRLHGTERVLIAYDADEAGDAAAERLGDELTRLGIEAYRVRFPRGADVKDANGYARAEQPAHESLGALLRGATWIGRAAPPVTAAPLAAAPAVLAAPAVSAASPAPAAPTARVSLASRSADGNEVVFTAGDRSYRVRGLAKATGTDALRVNLLAQRGVGVHVDTLDLYAARARHVFVAQAATELGIDADTVKRDVGAVLLALEGLVAAHTSAAPPSVPATDPDAMSEADRAAAVALLADPQLVERITADLAATGVVGEATNALVAYLAAVSRKLPAPLAVIIQSASAAGKTSLMEAVLALVPPEERVQYSAMTGQALFYLGETDLKHKVLAIVEEEGAARASYALKLLQSEGQLTIASTGKDPTTGRLVTETYHVEGPVAIVLTTTALDVDEELLNRALVLTVDESAAQTRAIHRRQRDRRTLDGLLARAARDELLTLHRNAQRLLQPLAVVNPYAPQLTFVDGRTRTRRDHEKYLTLIDAIALLHQHQRDVKQVTRGAQVIRYVEVTPADIALANRLAAAVLARALDELPPQTRRCLVALDAWLTTERPRDRRERVTFTAREARAATGLGATQMKRHLHRLVELEYALVHRAPHGHGITYELCYDASAGGAGTDEPPALAESLTTLAYDAERSGSAGERSGVGRPPVGPRSGGGRPPVPRAIARRHIAVAAEHAASDATHGTGPEHPLPYVVAGHTSIIAESA
jgi:DNA primase catalytic core